jgi:MSHA biogenesis protein MshI
MPWTWRKPAPTESMALAFEGSQLVFAHVADGSNAAAPRQVLRCGTLPFDAERPQDLARQLRSLGLPTRSIVALLPLDQCPLLQIEAPAVPPEELKSAARWRIKDLVDCHVDDLTLDVMLVGDGRPRAQKQAFVAAAPTRVIERIAAVCESAGLQLGAIDIRETAQRNLQHAIARAAGRTDRAQALLMKHGDQCLLTICAEGELFVARRFDWNGAMATALPGAFQRLSQPIPLDGGSGGDGDLPDFIDYGAESTFDAAAADVPRIVLDLQRSLDLWERSWPELPLAALSVDVGEHTTALVGLLARQPGLPVTPFDPRPAFDGLQQACRGNAALARHCLPLLGALLRDGTPL